jgi:hypothetical protein
MGGDSGQLYERRRAGSLIRRLVEKQPAIDVDSRQSCLPYGKRVERPLALTCIALTVRLASLADAEENARIEVEAVFREQRDLPTESEAREFIRTSRADEARCIDWTYLEADPLEAEHGTVRVTRDR